MADEMDIRQGDALFQIAEPEKPARARNAGRGIGIDLGTTHSLVAFAPAGAEPTVLRFEDAPAGSPESAGILPSVVTFHEGAALVGSAAIERAHGDPKGVFASAKRFVGRGVDEIDFEHPYEITGEDGVLRFVTPQGKRTPVEISAAILRRLKERAEAELGGPVDGAVITVPAYFDDAQRQATKDAARVAGLNVYRLLAEPTAAALAYGLQESGQGLFAIYDLGGGTFDISILRLADGVFQVLATGGDSALGGDDFDRALARVLAARAGLDTVSSEQHVALQAAARRAKEALSDRDSVVVEVPSLSLETTVTREEFDAAIEPLVERTATACLRTAKDAGIRIKELDAVVLVGGSTRVPLVREIVAETFRAEPKSELDPDRVVAHGAAIQADVLSGSARPGFTLLDVVPLSLGLETMGGIVEKIIPRNATIPIAARQVFTNYSEKQTGMTIHVVQGERELVDDCKSLARFELSGIPRLPPSMARVEITFELDADALLTVTARELMTGVRQQVQVKPTHGLSDEEVDGMVMASLDHAGEDFAARDLAEARVEFGRVALAVRTALEEVGHVEALLDSEQRQAIEQALHDGDVVMADPASDARAINAAREAIEAASTEFAQRRMERALRAGMSGKTLDQVESALEEEEKLAPRRGAHGAERID